MEDGSRGGLVTALHLPVPTNDRSRPSLARWDLRCQMRVRANWLTAHGHMGNAYRLEDRVRAQIAHISNFIENSQD